MGKAGLSSIVGDLTDSPAYDARFDFSSTDLGLGDLTSGGVNSGFGSRRGDRRASSQSPKVIGGGMSIGSIAGVLRGVFASLGLLLPLPLLGVRVPGERVPGDRIPLGVP